MDSFCKQEAFNLWMCGVPEDALGVCGVTVNLVPFHLKDANHAQQAIAA